MFNGFGWLRSASFTINENVERITNVGSGTFRKPDAVVKGIHEVSGSLEFWIAADFGGSMTDSWILKLPLDAYNLAHNGSIWTIPNTSSVYGSNDLPSFTLDIGHNKSGAIRMHQLTGCVVDSATFTWAKEEKFTVTYDFIGKATSSNSTSYTNGSATQSTVAPLVWSDFKLFYGTSASPTEVTDITSLEITFANNLTKNYDVQVTSPVRSLGSIIPGMQEISGTMTINLTTTSGMAMYDDLLGDTSAPYTANTIRNRGIKVEGWPSAAKGPVWQLYNVVIGEVPMDIDTSKHQEVTVPFTAQYYKFQMFSTDSTAPTNWSDES